MSSLIMTEFYSCFNLLLIKLTSVQFQNCCKSYCLNFISLKITYHLNDFTWYIQILLIFAQVHLEECLAELQRLKGMDTPYLKQLKEDLQGDQYKGHHVTMTNFKLENLMDTFIDNLTENIHKRYGLVHFFFSNIFPLQSANKK